MGVSLASYLGLSAAGVLNGHIYQLLTYPLIQRGFVEALFNGLVLWFIGGDLESRWGQKFYLKFLFVSTLGAGLFYLLVSLALFSDSAVFNFPLMGITGMTYSLLMAYGIIFSERLLTFMFFFPMKAKYFCALLAGIQLYMAIFSDHAKTSWAHLAAMACGFIYLKLVSGKSKGQGFGLWLKKREKQQLKKKLTLIKGDKPNEQDPKFWQ